MSGAVASLVLGVAVISTASLAGCSSQPAASSQNPAPSAAAPAQEATPAVTTLQIKDVVLGKGAEAKAGKSVTVDYTGWLTDGTKFDSSIDAGKPFTFPLGAGQVIPGWDQGVIGMKVGGTRRLTIPSDLAYGAQGSPPVIPPNATLVFEIKLLAVK